MAKKDVVGTCRLCKRRRVLCKSHYLGRALHRLAFTNGRPGIVMTPNVTLASARQLWAHLLCKECEGRLNRLGETPTFRWMDNGKSFRLLERMNLALEVKRERGAVTFSGAAMGVDTERLAFFALAVLWKGSVHKWLTIERQTTSVDLGSFQEPIRKFLLGQGPFPPDVYVLVAVCEDAGSRGTVYAPFLLAETHERVFWMLVRGLWFSVITDAKAQRLESLCCVQSDKKVLHRENCHKRFREAGRALNEKARVSTGVKS